MHLIQEIKKAWLVTMINDTMSINLSYPDIKPLNLEGGQCFWCGKYGHRRYTCPLLK